MKKNTCSFCFLGFVAAGAFAFTQPASVTATLTATINGTGGIPLTSSTFRHGFPNSNGGYDSTTNVLDAFNEETHPSFSYGYSTTTTESFSIVMHVGDFVNSAGNESGIVKIASVTSSNSGNAFSYDTQIDGFELFTDNGEGGNRTAVTTVTVTPLFDYTEGTEDFQGMPINADQAVNSAPSGTYNASITFEVSAS